MKLIVGATGVVKTVKDEDKRYVDEGRVITMEELTVLDKGTQGVGRRRGISGGRRIGFSSGKGIASYSP